MKLLKTAKQRYTFELAGGERDLLLQVLQLYPLVPSGYQPLSKASTAPEPSSQRLLDDALQEHRAQNRKQLDTLLANPEQWRPAEDRWLLTLSTPELDWLLQVLNDIRIGSWLQLGSPEDPLRTLNTRTARYYWAMEVAGFFQSHFLEILDG